MNASSVNSGGLDSAARYDANKIDEPELSETLL
jgi:hypothetical protein